MSTRTNSKVAGRLGEDRVVTYLQQLGYTILARNYLVHHVGEIDIIASERMEVGTELVCVEVKSWNSDHLPDLPVSLNQRKMNRMRRVCGDFLARQHDFRYDSIRFDVICVEADTFPPTIDHMRGAF